VLAMNKSPQDYHMCIESYILAYATVVSVLAGLSSSATETADAVCCVATHLLADRTATHYDRLLA